MLETEMVLLIQDQIHQISEIEMMLEEIGRLQLLEIIEVETEQIQEITDHLKEPTILLHKEIHPLCIMEVGQIEVGAQIEVVVPITEAAAQTGAMAVIHADKG